MNVAIYNNKLEFIAVLDVYESLIWTDRYDEAGDFEIYAGIDANTLMCAAKGNFVTIPDSEHVMVIEKIQTTTSFEEGDRIIISGRSIESLLSRRIIWKRTDYKGPLQDCICRILDDQFIRPADANRKMPYISYEKTTDPKITCLQMDAQYCGDNVYDIITSNCQDMNIGFKMKLIDGKFVFSLYAGTDHSFKQYGNTHVVFSPEYDNLITSNYTEDDTEYKNVALIGGEELENQPKPYSVVGSGIGMERREVYVDGSSISSEVNDIYTLTPAQYNVKLQSAGWEELTNYSKSSSFVGEVEPRVSFVYKRDFEIGDVVQIVNKYGQGAPSRITEFVINETVSGYQTYPTFDGDRADTASYIVENEMFEAGTFGDTNLILSRFTDYTLFADFTIIGVPLSQVPNPETMYTIFSNLTSNSGLFVGILQTSNIFGSNKGNIILLVTPTGAAPIFTQATSNSDSDFNTRHRMVITKEGSTYTLYSDKLFFNGTDVSSMMSKNADSIDLTLACNYYPPEDAADCSLYIGFASVGDVHTLQRLMDSIGVKYTTVEGYITTEVIPVDKQDTIIDEVERLGNIPYKRVGEYSNFADVMMYGFTVTPYLLTKEEIHNMLINGYSM